MDIDDKISRTKDLIAQREEIDRQLALIFNGGEPPVRRGRPPKSQSSGEPNPQVTNGQDQSAVVS